MAVYGETVRMALFLKSFPKNSNIIYKINVVSVMMWNYIEPNFMHMEAEMTIPSKEEMIYMVDHLPQRNLCHYFECLMNRYI